jgi:hypothetical protein
MSNKADRENNPNKGKGEGSDSKQIGPRQEYRRTGTAPDDTDAMAKDKGFGKPSTPFPY